MVVNDAYADSSSLGSAEVKRFTTNNFILEDGGTLSRLELVYETYGDLASDGRNAFLLTHGYTSSQHAAGRDARGEAGWWDGLVGPGRAIDTRKYFVISSNMIGSSYGSTGPASINPETGKPYGPDFPLITVADMVRAQHALLDSLGARHLVAVAGPSYGGYQAFQWAVTYPFDMDRIVAVVTAPNVTDGERMVADLRARFSTAPGWNGGRYYETGGMRDFMTRFRVETLKRYGIEAELASRFPDSAAREAEIRRMASQWAGEFDPNSLIVLAQARANLDAVKEFSKIRAKLLYVLCRTDKLFPRALAPQVMAQLKSAGVDTSYFEIDSDKGHLASGLDCAKWAPALEEFLGRPK
jgi:homoserine O-acetyltransferase